MQIVTGKTGTPHVTSQQFRQFIEGTVGQESYILNTAENLEPELVTNNKLKIRSGMMCHHGNLSVVEIGTYDEVTIPNGTQGMKRVILIANRYTRNEETGIEECEWHKFIGVSDPDEFKVPTGYTEGNLQEGDLVDDCPVFEIHQDGLNVVEIKKLLSVTSDIPTINASLADSFFEPGDEISLSGLTLDGYVTQAGTRLLMSIPVGKRLDKITGARTSLATGVVRQNGNYIVGSASDSHEFAQDQGTFLLMKDLGIIRYQYDFSGAPSEISNNDVMSIHFTAGTIQLL